MKMVMDTAPATSPDSACASGRIAFHEFLHPLPGTGIRSLVVIMTEVVWQRGDPRFRDIIQHMREGTVTREDTDLLMARRLSALSPEERADFVENALFVMPTWQRSVPITRQYLIDLGQPVARVDNVYEHPPNRRNHAVDEINLPARTALAVNAKVMLLCNFIMELKLMNGSVGVVKEIVYRSPEGPRGPNGPKTHPAYVIVDFPDFVIPEEQKLLPDRPSTWIPIAPVTLRCER